MDAVDQDSDTTITRSAWLALLVSTLVTFLVVIDISAVNVAFPSIRQDLDATGTTLSWIISGYNIVVGSLLLVAGRMADSIGRRRVFLPGVAVFGLGSLLSGLAPTVELLIAARLIQGVGGAVTFASSFAVMLPDFPPARRSTAIGFAGATGALGAVVGPALGSLLIDLWSWRIIFLVNVPLCLLVLVLGPRWLRESKDPDATGRIDLVGVAIGTAAVALMMFAIVQSESWGLPDVRVWALFVLGLAMVPVLIRRSKNHTEPLLNLELFRYRSFSAVSVGISLYGLGFTSGFLVNSLMLQDLWDQPIRMVGLALVPGPLLAGIVSPLTGRYADRYGHRWILGLGCLLLAAAYLLQAILLDGESRLGLFVLLSLLSGVGVGLTVATWSSASIADIPPARFGVASATNNTLRQAAYALGIAVAITLIADGDVADGVAPGTASIAGFRWAWLWVTGCYALAAVAVMALYPAGSSRDRAGADTGP